METDLSVAWGSVTPTTDALAPLNELLTHSMVKLLANAVDERPDDGVGAFVTT